MVANSSMTTKDKPTPRSVSGLSEPFRWIILPFFNLICAVFSKACSITSAPNIFNFLQAESLAC